MKKTVIFLFLFLLCVMPVIAQNEDLAGTWIGFAGKDEILREETDFTLLRFSADGSSLAILDTDGEKYDVYNGTLKTEEGKTFIECSDGEKMDLTFHWDAGKLILSWDWNDERTYFRIDDSYFPEDPESSLFLGGNKKYWITLTEDEGIRILEYLGDEETLEIPAVIFGFPVKEIDDCAITFTSEMKHLILPDGIRSIGYHAFEENGALEDVRLPATLESIGDGAFMYCYNLKEIIIPEGIKTIGDGTFWQCSFLKRVVLPESVEEIHPDAFHGSDIITFYGKAGSYTEQFCKENEFNFVAMDNEGLEQIYSAGPEPSMDPVRSLDEELAGAWIVFNEGEFTIFRFKADGSDLRIIESNGYYPEGYSGTWESDGETVTFHQATEYPDEENLIEMPYYFIDKNLVIDWYGQKICTRIDDSYFPEDPANSPFLGEDKDYWISQLEDGTLEISGYCGNDETVTVPDTVFGFPVTSIGETAFMSIDGLKHVIVPHGVTFIGRQAFSYNDDLESVELPDTLKTLEYSAFMYAKSLKEIEIPEGVTFLDSDTFWGCDSLERVVLPASLEAIDESGAFDPQRQEAILFVVPEGSFAEQYCRENELTCVTAGNEQLTGGTDRDDEVVDEPVDEVLPEESASPDVEKELYDEAMAFYNEESYYSARQLFLESAYGDSGEMAEKCIREWPAAGEIWRDRSQWLQDMELTIIVELPEEMAMLIRIYKDNAPVSYLFLSGSDSVTVRLPGNGYYTIKDGVGTEWFGMKEAFGRDGTYETMTFDENGTESVYLKSNYAYTLSINVSSSDAEGDDVYSETEDWDNFVE